MIRNYRFIDNLVRFHVDPATTGGQFGMAEMLGRPGDQPPLHVHDHDDEGFHVAEGELTLWIEGVEPVVLAAGHSVVAPRGIPHTYRVTGDGIARWFVTSTPGNFAEMVMDYGEPTAEQDLWTEPAGPPEMDRLNAACEAQGIRLLGPPGTLPAGHGETNAGLMSVPVTAGV